MRYRVMVVEDDSSIAQILLVALGTLPNVEAVRAYSGEEAIRLWEERPADVVLVDYNMREMTGVELIRYLRERGATQPMLMVTAYDSIDVQHAASAAGVTSFITKPFFIDQLVAQIRAFLPKESTAPA